MQENFEVIISTVSVNQIMTLRKILQRNKK